MQIEFVGVGEAFDENLPNNSHILLWPGCHLLVDCGYAVPHPLWRMHPDPNYIDAIYLSHRHADHYFGVPSYLLRLAEEQRQKDVEIICSEGMKQVTLDMIDYAYQGILSHFPFQVVFHEVSDQIAFDYRGVRMEFAASSHPVKNFAISVSSEDKKYAYSGDGNFNAHTRKLYRSCTLLVHEAYTFDTVVRGHVRAVELLKMAKEENVQVLALTHLQRDVRKNKRGDIEKMAEDVGIAIVIPEPGDTYEI